MCRKGPTVGLVLGAQDGSVAGACLEFQETHEIEETHVLTRVIVLNSMIFPCRTVGHQKPRHVESPRRVYSGVTLNVA